MNTFSCTRHITHFVFFLVIMTLVTSCGCGNTSNRDKSLNQETRKWAPFQQGDQSEFLNDSNTGLLEVTSREERIETYIPGDECPEGKEEVIYVELTSGIVDMPILIRLHNESMVKFQYRNSSWSLAEDTKSTSQSATFHPTLSVGQRSYENVLVLTCTTCEDLQEVLYAKGTGVVSLTTNEGVWLRK